MIVLMTGSWRREDWLGGELVWALGPSRAVRGEEGLGAFPPFLLCKKPGVAVAMYLQERPGLIP